MKESVIGIDVSKESLECVVSGEDEVVSFPNSDDGIGKLITWARQREAKIIALESTGKYHRRCEELLQNASLPVRAVHPKQIRDFAKAIGILAKTDAIDCRVIASFAAMVKPKERVGVSKNERILRELVERRQQLIAMKSAELSRLECVASEIKRDINFMIRTVSLRIKAIEQKINALLAEPEFASKVEILQAIPAVGPVLTSTLLAALPELGTLDKRKIAALAGVAPFNRDSGTLRGKRTTCGGRSTVRKALYMATLVATRHNAWIKQFYQRLLANGKSPMTALVAAMRKFLTAINAVIRDNRAWV